VNHQIDLLVKKGEDLSKIKLFKVEFQHTSDDGSVVSFDFREQEYCFPFHKTTLDLS
jgi:hypothetical protein